MLISIINYIKIYPKLILNYINYIDYILYLDIIS